MISYAICTHNEGEYIRTLFHTLQLALFDGHKEIVIVDDFSTDELTLSILEEYKNFFGDMMRVEKHALNSDYSAHKNYLNSLCKGEWIFNLDADEFMHQDFLSNLDDFVSMNSKCDAFWIPRINTVDGLTREHVARWNWSITKFDTPEFIRTVSDISPQEYELLKFYDFVIEETQEHIKYYQPIVCWPDYQMRLYRNIPDVKWQGKVHEKLTGFKLFGTVTPDNLEYAIRHFKQIDRQEKQNEFYEKIMR